jgi:hypothetical protein
MSLKAAFIFVAPEADPKKHHAIVETPMVALTVVGVPTYDAAVEIAKKLVDEGNVALELCGGFGIEGTAAVKAAVKGKAAVGVVRFENHPGLDFKSGDEIFQASTLSKAI